MYACVAQLLPQSIRRLANIQNSGSNSHAQMLSEVDRSVDLQRLHTCWFCEMFCLSEKNSRWQTYSLMVTTRVRYLSGITARQYFGNTSELCEDHIRTLRSKSRWSVTTGSIGLSSLLQVGHEFAKQCTN